MIRGSPVAAVNQVVHPRLLAPVSTKLVHLPPLTSVAADIAARTDLTMGTNAGHSGSLFSRACRNENAKSASSRRSNTGWFGTLNKVRTGSRAARLIPHDTSSSAAPASSPEISMTQTWSATGSGFSNTAKSCRQGPFFHPSVSRVRGRESPSTRRHEPSCTSRQLGVTPTISARIPGVFLDFPN